MGASKALQFVKQHNLAVVVKSTGHEWFGRNRQVGTLLLFTHPMQELTWISNFQPAGCSERTGEVIQVGAGVQFISIYDSMKEKGRVFSGGTCSSVGHVGYSLGGGYGQISRMFGSGASNLVEAQVVLADGTIVTTSECNEHKDLHWAIRGGGPGVGALVTRATYLTFPEPSFHRIWGPMGNHQWDWGAQDQEQQIVHTAKFITWYKGLADTGEIKHFGGVVRIQNSRVTPVLAVTGLTTQQCKDLVAPLGLVGQGVCTEERFDERYGGRVCDGHDNDEEDAAWCSSFPGEYVTHTLQRYVLPSYLDTPAKIRAVAEKFVTLQDCSHGDDEWRLRLNYNLGGAPADVLARNQKTSVHPQVSESLFNFAMLGKKNLTDGWTGGRPQSDWGLDVFDDEREFDVVECHERIVNELSEVLPGAGQYSNEGDRWEQDWQRSYWGDNYAGLLRVKQEYDPENVFQCHQCVGSEDFDKCYKY